MCRRYLSELVDNLDLVAVISGRPLTEVMGMVGVEGLAYVGNHGLEMWIRGVPQMWPGSEQYVKTIADAVDAIKDMAETEGLYVENKGLTASIHYRNSSNPDAAKSMILAAVTPLTGQYGLRMTEGRMVVELRPDIDVDKGAALAFLVESYGLSGLIYIGDDVTDIDAFKALHDSEVKGVAIGVGSDEAPPELYNEADYVVYGVSDVERFLVWLVDATAD
jgi:trehalose 6-phosphate phosphatase